MVDQNFPHLRDETTHPSVEILRTPTLVAHAVKAIDGIAVNLPVGYTKVKTEDDIALISSADGWTGDDTP